MRVDRQTKNRGVWVKNGRQIGKYIKSAEKEINFV